MRAKVGVARSAASRLLNELEIRNPPVDVMAAAAHCQLQVVLAPYDGETSGLLVRQDDGTKVVGVNSNNGDERKRFTIAHEIGHALLHLEDDNEMFIDKPREVLFRDAVSSRATDAREIEANAFAAELLMPKTIVRRAFYVAVQSDRDDALVGKLATEFEVSRTAMAYRLVNLGLMDPA